MMADQVDIVESLWKMDVASCSTNVGRDKTVIRFWKPTDLLRLCDSDADARGAMRKAFSQGAIKKAIALHQVEPYVDAKDRGIAGEDAMTRYSTALSVALRTGRALPEDKVALSEFRRKHHISESQHAN